MARDEEAVFTGEGVDRRKSGYYSTPEIVTDYISDRLISLNPSGRHLLDPCIGKGEMVFPFLEKEIEVDGLDVIKHSNHEKVNFEKRDFLSYYSNRKKELTSKNYISDKYDYYVANPPYKSHKSGYIKSNKARLENIFPYVGSLNIYSMFISALIDFAKPGALIGIISQDSFLNARGYEPLRKKILSKTTVHDVILCPLDLFSKQKVYVRTCIMILQKGDKYQEEVRYLNRTASYLDFKKKIKSRELPSCEMKDIVLRHGKDKFEIIVDVPNKIQNLFNKKRVGDIYNCITGISTGNDGKYLSTEKTDKHDIPFYKNPASRKFYMEPDGYLWSKYIEESQKVSNFIVRNEPLLKKSGLTCSSMGVEFGACRLPSEGLFGVNPSIICGDDDIWWMLSYINSNLVQYIIRGILRRSNMVTSGYVSRVPLLDLTEPSKTKLSRMSKKAYSIANEGGNVGSVMGRINSLIYNEAGLKSRGEASFINNFCSNVVEKS